MSIAQFLSCAHTPYLQLAALQNYMHHKTEQEKSLFACIFNGQNLLFINFFVSVVGMNHPRVALKCFNVMIWHQCLAGYNDSQGAFQS